MTNRNTPLLTMGALGSALARTGVELRLRVEAGQYVAVVTRRSGRTVVKLPPADEFGEAVTEALAFVESSHGECRCGGFLHVCMTHAAQNPGCLRCTTCGWCGRWVQP